MFIDNIFFEFLHLLCIYAGGFFTPFFRFISFLGEKGWFFLFIAIVLMLRKRTRWVGLTVFVSIFIAFIVGSVIFKPLFMRPRPYLSDAANIYKYWLDAGGIEDSGYALPSGHTLAVASCFISLYITMRRGIRELVVLPGIIFTILMIMSRCYFMHHHLTDCLFSIVISFFTAYIAKLIVKILHKVFKNNERVPFFNFILNFDFFELFAPKVND